MRFFFLLSCLLSECHSRKANPTITKQTPWSLSELIVHNWWSSHPASDKQSQLGKLYSLNYVIHLMTVIKKKSSFSHVMSCFMTAPTYDGISASNSGHKSRTAYIKPRRCLQKDLFGGHIPTRRYIFNSESTQILNPEWTKALISWTKISWIVECLRS